SAIHDVISRDAAGEGLVLHLLANRLCIHFSQRLRGLHQRGGSDESSQLVAGEENFLHVGLSLDASVVRMRHDGAADVLGISTLFEDLVADKWMLFRSGKALI